MKEKSEELERAVENYKSKFEKFSTDSRRKKVKRAKMTTPVPKDTWNTSVTKTYQTMISYK